MASKLMLAALTLVCFVAATTAIKCHVCTYSEVDGKAVGSSDCKDEFTKDKSESCGDSVKYCGKDYASGKSDGKEGKTISRYCGSACTKVGDTDVDQGDAFDGDYKTYCCEGDDCNSASAIIPTLGLLLASLALTGAF